MSDRPSAEDGKLRRQLAVALLGNYPETTASEQFLNDCMRFIDAYTARKVQQVQIDDRLVMLGLIEANQANLTVGEIISIIRGQVESIENELTNAKDQKEGTA